MENKLNKEWMCGCGVINCATKCDSCGEPQGERKEYYLCSKLKKVCFLDIPPHQGINEVK